MTKQPRDGDLAEEWPIPAFLDQFAWVDKEMEGRKFAFILGAGASVSSGIPTGSQLVDRWLLELHARDLSADGRPIEEWASNKTLSIRDYDREFKYDNRAAYYPQIYDKRFGDDRAEGYRYLESVMEDARPGVGYSMLAQILGKSRHKVVITTNFDNLVADAVLMYTNTFAQVCGHEALTSFIDVHPQRPLVAKIHRDLLLGPQNDPYRTNVLHESWAAALRNLFAVYTPIVIGYGGNDGSLMNFLFTLNPNSIPGGIFWCYKKGAKPDARIQELIQRQSGKMLGIPGFDEFMFLVGQELGCQTQEKWIVSDANDRAKKYESQLGEVLRQLDEDAKRPDRKELAEQVQSAIQSAVPEADKEGSWIAWELKAQRESDPNKREQIYRDGISHLPHSAELHEVLGFYMWTEHKDLDEAERLLDKALKLAPNRAETHASLALFLQEARKKDDKAERLYRNALKLDPKNAQVVANYALFLEHNRKDYEQAERLYRKALELGPDEDGIHGNYAVFLNQIRGDYDGAERSYLLAIELGPNHPFALSNYCAFLIERGRDIEATAMSDRAWSPSEEKVSRANARTALYRAILLRLDNKNDLPALGRLKTLFDMDFIRTTWSLTDLLAAVDDRLPDDNRKLYHAIADALLDEEKVAALDEFPRWKAVEAIPLDEPWPPLAEQD